MKSAILAGGQGSRLRPITLRVPKALLPVAHLPILTHQIARMQGAGIQGIAACLRRGDGVDWDAYQKSMDQDLDLIASWEDTPLGTGGAFRALLDWLEGEPLFGINGDDITDVDPAELLRIHRDRKADVTIALHPVPTQGDLSGDAADASTFGNVSLDADGWIQSFLEKPSAGNSTGLINSGQYVIEPHALSTMAAGRKLSIEREGFPQMLEQGLRIAGVVLEGYHCPINTAAQYLQIHRDLYDGRWTPEWLPGAAGHNQIGDHCQIFPDARLGDNVTLGANCSVGTGAALEDVVAFSGVQIGTDVQIRRAVISPGVRIGHHASVQDCVLAAGSYVPPWTSLGVLEPGRRGEKAT